MSRFQDKESAAYVQAVAALQTLLAKEGGEAVRRAYADAIHEHEKKRYATSRTVKESFPRHPCIHKLFGRRCPTEKTPYDTDAECPHIPGQDHVSAWQRDGKTHIIVSQPYSMGYETLKETVEFCEKWGLQAYIDAYGSWHFPGATVLVEYLAKGKKRSE